MLQLVEKYKNMANVDKVTRGIELSEKVIEKAQSNLNQLVSNMDDFDRLHEKSKQTADLSRQFEKNTGDIKKEMVWRNRKMCLFKTAGVGAIGGFVYFFFFL